MSRRKLTTHYIGCDFPGCIDYFKGGEGVTLHKVKRQAQRKGWAVSRGDLCPHHLSIQIRHITEAS